MRFITVDARRYVWCRARALWTVGLAQSLLEDVHGALRAEQNGLLAYAARMLAEACAVSLILAINFERPIPTAAMRPSWALERLQGHELREPCWELIRGSGDLPAEEVAKRCEDLMERTRAIVGEIPDVLTPEGHFPALAMARDLIKVMEQVGEKESFVPSSWITFS